ncbi:MAG: COG1361 S-layer family protein, partial [Actinomycetota bacterium]
MGVGRLGSSSRDVAIDRARAKKSPAKRGIVLLLVVATLMFATAAAASAASLNVNLDQCANGSDGLTSPCAWQNGDLNAQNSQWHEGDGVPFRAVISGLDAGAHSIHINYDFNDGGKFAYDMLETYNTTETVDRSASMPTGVSFPSGSAITTAFPHDPFFDTDGIAYNPETGTRNLTTYGADSVSIDAPTHDTGSGTGDIVIHFTNSSSDTVVLLWAGHLAIGTTGWGDGLGAGSISGAPFHMRTQQLDDSGNKNQDRSIQPGAIILQPSLSITKVADATTVNAGDQVGFTITVSNAGPGDASSVSMTDTLPTNPGLSWSIAGTTGGPTCGISSGVLTCTAATLTAGSNFTVHITSPTTSATCGTINNTAAVTATNVSQLTASASITVNCPSLAITKVADATTVNAGDTIGYTITVTNNGAGTASGVKLSDTVPTNLGLSWTVTSQSAGWNNTCAITAGVLTCGGANGVSLGSGLSLSVHISSPTTSATCGTVANTASATSGNDGSPSVGPVNITVNCASLAITKVADATTVNAGEDIGYTITITNNGAGTASGVKLSDTLPSNAGLSWTVTSQSAGWNSTCAISAGVLTCGGANGVS